MIRSDDRPHHMLHHSDQFQLHLVHKDKAHHCWNKILHSNVASHSIINLGVEVLTLQVNSLFAVGVSPRDQ